MDSGDATEGDQAGRTAPGGPGVDIESLERATAHLLGRTRRQAAELSRLIGQLERLQGDIRRHQETLGSRADVSRGEAVPFARRG